MFLHQKRLISPKLNRPVTRGSTNLRRKRQQNRESSLRAATGLTAPPPRTRFSLWTHDRRVHEQRHAGSLRVHFHPGRGLYYRRQVDSGARRRLRPRPGPPYLETPPPPPPPTENGCLSSTPGPSHSSPKRQPAFLRGLSEADRQRHSETGSASEASKARNRRPSESRRPTYPGRPPQAVRRPSGPGPERQPEAEVTRPGPRAAAPQRPLSPGWVVAAPQLLAAEGPAAFPGSAQEAVEGLRPPNPRARRSLDRSLERLVAGVPQSRSPLRVALGLPAAIAPGAPPGKDRRPGRRGAASHPRAPFSGLPAAGPVAAAVSRQRQRQCCPAQAPRGVAPFPGSRGATLRTPPLEWIKVAVFVSSHVVV
ncbi:translation initiation factor IF-2-like [Choloepus didactylus]|uniref:translation initiation factor IF-2-like n=1 Tax=Choloepus didactylus TaxID=27675 RepID=UPI0018A122A0|nr:translation initiation factor IF-2-like [Choloepus didactylus]